MENTRLEKKAKVLLADTDNILDEFISEINELESENAKLNEKIAELEYELKHRK
jgi:uncharacterized protein (UPF0335 family)